MRKKVSLFLFSLTLVPFFSFFSCSNIYQFYDYTPKSSNNSLLKNQKLQEFVDSVFANNESQKHDYIANQLNQNLVKISTELKYSLIFARPYFDFSNDEYFNTRKSSSYTIHSYLAKNWLFLLKNIEKLSFVFNPYLSRFVKNPNEIKAEKIQNKTIKITNKNFDFIKIDREQDQFIINNVYYLIFDNNKFIRFTVFGSNSELKTKLDYNIFYLEQQIPDKFLFVNSIENWIKAKEKSYFQNKLNQAKENLKDEFEEKKLELQSKISDLDSQTNLEDENDSNFCSLENPEKCSEGQLKFLESLKSKSGFGKKVSQISEFYKNSLDLELTQEKTAENSNSNSENPAHLINNEKPEKPKSELAKLEEKYKKDLENLETDVQKLIYAEKNDLYQSNFFTDITSDISSFNSPFNFYKYSLFSIDLEKTTEKEQNKILKSPEKSNYFNKYSDFIDKKLEIKSKNETEEEFNSRKVYEYIFNAIWKNDEKAKVFYLNNYRKQENIEKLEAKWNTIQKNLVNLQFERENYDAIIQEYENFVSENWLFILERLDKIALLFHKWYLFPDQFAEDGKLKVAHNQEFKDFVANQEPLSEPFFYSNKFLESVSEGDTSLILTTFKDLYILKQNTLINLKIETSGIKPKVRLNPYVYHFPKTKNKISVKILTEIFHQALYHASKESYLDFENDFVKKFRYNLPAQMIFSEKFKGKNENK
ncbi:hypothetical protein DR085_00910 [Mycoplasma flocculare]|uniref:aromatic motif membrane protein n=1 Tax=Mesomycoplasma flocculare TaxID=2128 RepID=UPI00136E9D3B|nr:aromatic motif membrane protein [Mesomycoplasma flocculare]MXR13441.1 hypothetical protein [Mesomycoplasma flocculare]